MLLLNADSRLGHIQANWVDVNDNLQKANRHSIITLCVVIACSVVVAVVIAYLLTKPLHRLAAGMNALARLELEESRAFTQQQSSFSEIAQPQYYLGSLIRFLYVILTSYAFLYALSFPLLAS